MLENPVSSRNVSSYEKKVEGLVFYNRTAQGQAGLHARECLLGGDQFAGGRIDLSRKCIAGLKRFVAEIAEDIAVDIVATALGDDIDNAAGGAAVFGVVIAEDQLKFLHRFLGYRSADSIDGVVHRIGAVNADHVGARALAADIQAAGGRGADGRSHVTSRLGIRQSEVDVVAAIDGQIIDAAGVYRLRDFSFGGFDRGCFRGDRDALLHAAKFELGVERGILPHCHRDGFVLKGREVGATIDHKPVLTGRQTNKVVATVVIGDGGTLGRSDRVYYRNLGAFHRQALRVDYRPRQRCSVHLCGRVAGQAEG